MVVAIGLVSLLSMRAGAESLFGPSVEVRPPANATSTPHESLTGISCTTTACVAVGSYETTSRAGVPMIATRRPAGWTRAIAASLPAGHATAYSASALTGVSCPDATSCVAVGSYEDTSRSVLPLVAVESAGTWGTGFTIGLPSSPGANELSRLSSVSCAAVGDCTAVGSFIDQHGTPALLAASATSGSWGTGTQIALPPGAGTRPRALGSVGLDAVTCTDATDCVGVGSYLDGAGSYLPIHVQEVSGVWRAAARAGLPTGTPGIGSAALDSVSCIAVGSCVAVGYDTNSAGRMAPVIERESGGAWGRVVAIGFPARFATPTAGSLSAVACTKRSCTAVGSIVATDGTVIAVVLVDDGGHWQPLQRLGSLPTADPHPRASMLAGIACPASNACVGIGGLGTATMQGAFTSSVAMATRITPVRPIVNPAPPSHVAAKPGPGRLSVSWMPSGDGGAAVSSFTATASPGAATCASSATSCVISGLDDGTRYSVAVTATNVHGTSRASAPSPGEVPGTAPSAPRGLGITRSHGRAALHWQASTASPGDPVTRYVVTAVAAGVPARRCASSKTSCALEGLARRAAYTVWVVAYNAVGASARSAERRFTSL